jgi:hypothetical protein
MIWNSGILSLVARILDHPRGWCKNYQLKYIVIRIDTRDGTFLLFDRDNNPITLQQVLETFPEENR